MTFAIIPPSTAGRKFDVYKREINNHVHRIGTVVCDNLTQANTRARYVFGKGLRQGEAVWAVEPEKETAAQ